MSPKMMRHRCHPNLLPSHRGKLITFLRAQLMIFHPPTLSHLQLESKTHNKALQATGAALSVLDGVGDRLLPGFVAASFPAPVPELGR
jgi:hypothetical protein